MSAAVFTLGLFTGSICTLVAIALCMAAAAHLEADDD